MKLRLRFVWNKAAHRNPRARDLTGLARLIEDESAAGHVLTLWLDARALLKLGTAVAIVGWFSLAGGLAYWLHRDPHNRVGFADLACPWRWSHIRELRGEGYLAAGLEALAADRIESGLSDLRNGLARQPDAPAARLAAAQVYARLGYYAGVRDVMLPQLGRSEPSREYLRFLLETAGRNDDHATMLAASERMLGRARVAADRGWLFEQQAAALVALERFPEALAALESAGRNRSLDGRRLRIQALFGTGRAAEAADEVQAWDAAVPPEFRLPLLAEASRRAGRLDEMEQAIETLRRLHPAETDPVVFAIGRYVEAGWRDAAWAELQDALRRFDADPQAVARIERACVDAGAVELVAACVENTEELGRPAVPALLDLAVVQLSHGTVAAAEHTYARLLEADRRERERPEGTSHSYVPVTAEAGRFLAPARPRVVLLPAVRDWLRTLLDAVELPAANPADLHAGVLAAKPYPLMLYVHSAAVLARAGHWPAVAQVARIGLVQHPGSTQLTRWSTTAAEKIAALPPPARPEPPPVRAVASAAEPALPSGPDYAAMPQADFYAQLEAQAGRGDWAEVEAMIRAVKKAGPSWLAQATADLSWREIRCILEQGDVSRGVNWATQRLQVRPLEAPRALALARDWRTRDGGTTGRRLAEAVVAAVPQFKAGQAYLQELQAEAAAGKH